MKLATARVVLRPRDLPEIFDLAIRVVVRDLRLFASLGLIVSLPWIVLCSLAVTEPDPEPVGAWLLALLGFSLVQGVYTTAAGQALFAPRARVRPILAASLWRSVPYLVTWTLTALINALGSAVMFVGLLITAPLVWFANETVLLERFGPFAAISRAARLGRRDAARVLGAALLSWLATGAAVLMAEAIGQGLVGFVLQLGAPFGELFEAGFSVYAAIGLFAAGPLVAVARFLLYLDLRTRHDAWDLQVRLASVAAEDVERRAHGVGARGRGPEGLR